MTVLPGRGPQDRSWVTCEIDVNDVTLQSKILNSGLGAWRFTILSSLNHKHFDGALGILWSVSTL